MAAGKLYFDANRSWMIWQIMGIANNAAFVKGNFPFPDFLGLRLSSQFCFAECS